MTKEEAIKEAYGEYYESTKHRIDENGFAINVHKNCQIVLKEGLSVDFMVYKDKIRPHCLQGIEDNNGWKPSGYHDKQTDGKNPFTDGKYYHIGFMQHYNRTFHYQGIYKYKSGFDHDGYPLKPFPTHYIEIDEPVSPIHI